MQCAPREAGVLVPLYEDAHGAVHVVLTLRASSLSKHAGEVALPGGKRDSADASIEDTALREAHEEVRHLHTNAHLRTDGCSVLR